MFVKTEANLCQTGFVELDAETEITYSEFTNWELTPENILLREELKQTVRELARSLSPPYRAVITLYHL